MARKFIIILPTLCCGNNSAVNKISIAIRTGATNGVCNYCGKIKMGVQAVTYLDGSVEISRIIWIEDPDKDISHDTIQEILDKVKA